MKQLLFIFFVAFIAFNRFLFQSSLYADSYTFDEYFDNDESVFVDHQWQVYMFNYTSPGWSYSYDMNGYNFAVTDLYHGTQNPRSDVPNNIGITCVQSLPSIDGTFSLTYQFAWDGSLNSDGFTHHIYLKTVAGTYGSGITDMWHLNKGSAYLYAYNGNPADTVQTYSGAGTLNGYSGSGTVVISRNESDQISVSVSAGGVTLSSSIIDASDLQQIRLVYGGYSPTYYGFTFPTLYSDSISLTGESSIYQEPVVVPEPLSALLLGLSLVFYKKRI